MTLLAQIVLVGWIPLALLLFLVLPPRRAVILGFLLGWLFLPVTGYKIPGFMEYSKTTIVPMGTLLGVLLFDPRRVAAFRPRWFDLPMLVWCVAPFASSLSNGLGPYDGISASLFQTVIWGVPYLIGRFYFNDAAGTRDLALGLLLGGILYLPFCLFEIRMSPVLHTTLYGLHPASFYQTRRFGGWRPTVFLQHGLAVGMWMCMSALVNFWLWKTSALKRYAGLTAGMWLVALLVVAVLCKSTGAVLLLALGMAMMWSVVSLRTTTPVVILVLATALYIGLRATDAWSPQFLVEATQSLGAERADSLEFRVRNETAFVQNALQQPLLGWGKWGRGMLVDDGKEHAVTDGLWLITFLQEGLVGLVGLTLTFLLPPLLICRRIPARDWSNPVYAPVVILAMVSALVMIDNILNAMPNPCLVLAAAGAMGFQPELLVRKPARRLAASPSTHAKPMPRTAAPSSSPKISEFQ